MYGNPKTEFNPCATCGDECQTKKLRLSDSGGYEIFCKECIEEAKVEYEYNKTKLQDGNA